ncbi:unnamed protein product [Cochlearia groenlandica]
MADGTEVCVLCLKLEIVLLQLSEPLVACPNLLADSVFSSLSVLIEDGVEGCSVITVWAKVSDLLKIYIIQE